jgi:NADH:ubiquinone oxidoreductase subunit 6 (subunit J)
VMLHLAWKGLATVFKAGDLSVAPQPTVDAIGRAFLTRDQYLIPFELASLVLLGALVGSVYLARRKKES